MRSGLKRLRSGELDGLVLAYLKEHKADGPLTPYVIAQGLGGRSNGAVTNCLMHLAKDKKVRQAKKTPRAYAIREAKAR